MRALTVCTYDGTFAVWSCAGGGFIGVKSACAFPHSPVVRSRQCSSSRRSIVIRPALLHDDVQYRQYLDTGTGPREWRGISDAT